MNKKEEILHGLEPSQDISVNVVSGEINTYGLDYTTSVVSCQQELSDKFIPKKSLSLYLSDVYGFLGKDYRANTVYSCGTVLDFGLSADGAKLVSANFCKDKLCPTCNWRRSLKIFGQVSQVIDFLEPDFDFLFLTLTVLNVRSSELEDAIDKLNYAYTYRFARDKRYKKAVKGAIRVLEVTRNRNKASKSYNTWHPHLHVILAVRKDYFQKFYIKQFEWLDMWRDAYEDDRITQVDIRRIRAGDGCPMHKAVAEVSKYAVKSSDYLDPSDDLYSIDSVAVLSDSLFRRRLISFTGCFRKAKAALALDDIEDGDLVQTDIEVNKRVYDLIVRLRWRAGFYVFDSFVDK